AIVANGGSAEQAQAKLDEWKTAMVNAAEAAGISKEAAQQLADELFRMPAAKNVSVTVGIKVPRGSAAFLSQNGYLPAYGQGVTEYRFGGITAAATGRVMQAGIATSPTVLFGERETEQEAYIPKRGNYARSMGILQTAAGWMGADVVPRGGYMAGGGGTSAAPINIIVSAGSGLGGAVVGGLQFDVQHAGAGDVQNRYGRRGRN
ncbi:MAG TPA: hypothetical protein VJ277_08105, partial [Gemmatimonadales bacterium]|nr:hypothetical protein [Gemmatimonadales bacterium]